MSRRKVDLNNYADLPENTTRSGCCTYKITPWVKVVRTTDYKVPQPGVALRRGLKIK